MKPGGEVGHFGAAETGPRDAELGHFAVHGGAVAPKDLDHVVGGEAAEAGGEGGRAGFGTVVAPGAAFGEIDFATLVGAAFFLEELEGDEVGEKVFHFRIREVSRVEAGAEGVVPEGGGEFVEAVAGGAALEVEIAVVAGGAAFGGEEAAAWLDSPWNELARTAARGAGAANESGKVGHVLGR